MGVGETWSTSEAKYLCRITAGKRVHLPSEGADYYELRVPVHLRSLIATALGFRIIMLAGEATSDRYYSWFYILHTYSDCVQVRRSGESLKRRGRPIGQQQPLPRHGEPVTLTREPWLWPEHWIRGVEQRVKSLSTRDTNNHQ